MEIYGLIFGHDFVPSKFGNFSEKSTLLKSRGNMEFQQSFQCTNTSDAVDSVSKNFLSDKQLRLSTKLNYRYHLINVQNMQKWSRYD